LRVAVLAPAPAARAVVAEAPEEPLAPAADEPAAEVLQPKTGIAAFPAPGTKRIKPGLKVPDDFQLPPGFVRHYQATDKGQMLEPILVYHPDYELVDARGQVIPLPPDRVVPPEMAPAGLPLETLEIPVDAYADRDERGPGTNAEPGQTGVEEEKPEDREP
jgi:hypothetical protein